MTDNLENIVVLLIHFFLLNFSFFHFIERFRLPPALLSLGPPYLPPILIYSISVSHEKTQASKGLIQTTVAWWNTNQSITVGPDGKKEKSSKRRHRKQRPTCLHTQKSHKTMWLEALMREGPVADLGRLYTCYLSLWVHRCSDHIDSGWALFSWCHTFSLAFTLFCLLFWRGPWA